MLTGLLRLCTNGAETQLLLSGNSDSCIGVSRHSEEVRLVEVTEAAMPHIDRQSRFLSRGLYRRFLHRLVGGGAACATIEGEVSMESEAWRQSVNL